MKRRSYPDDPELIGTAPLPLFDQRASVEAGLSALADTAAKHERQIERLIPLAQELAAKAAPHGITVSNLRLAAVHRGLLTGQERGRELSYLGKVMELAGLEATGEWRRSDVVKSHGNLNQVWRAA